MNGNIVDGAGKAGEFVNSVVNHLQAAVGFRPYPGTLNISGVSSLSVLPAERCPIPGDDYCDGLVVQPCRVSGVRAAVVRPLVPEYPAEKTEIIAPVKLRDLFTMTAGDGVRLSGPDECIQTKTLNGQTADQFDAVVFDLDGTLVDLQVEWSDLHTQIKELLGACLDARLESYSPLEVFEIARENGLYSELHEITRTAEVDGAHSAHRRDSIDLLSELSCPIAICTANAEQAATIALERFGVLEHIDVIIARDTIPEDKPHPRTLLTCLEMLDTDPGNSLYVGNEMTDEELAINAGTSYTHIDSLRVD